MEVSGKRVETDVSITSEPGDICEPCQRGKTEATAVGLCIECDEYMCQTCFDHHLKAKICMDHTLTDDLKASVSSKGRFQDVERCSYHNNEIVKYYCRKHDTVGCGDCMLSGGHNACQPEYIKNVAKNFKNKKAFQDLVKQAEGIEKDKNLTASLNQNGKRKTKEQREKALKDVQKFRTDINNSLDMAEAATTSKIKIVASENNDNLTAMEKAIESLSVELEEVKMKMNTELQGRNALFINAVGCKSQLNRIARSLDEAKSKTVLKDFLFNPGEDLQRIAMSAKALGNLQITDHTKTMTTPPVNVQKMPSVYRLNSFAEDSVTKQRKYNWTETEEDCVICMDKMVNPKTLTCGHRFCCDCIKQSFHFKKLCPICGAVFGVITGDQPKGRMTVSYDEYNSCAGYSECGQIIVTFTFPGGKQEDNHPNPGFRYKGIIKQAYLPDNKEGRLLLEMLKVAFQRKLVFAMGCTIMDHGQSIRWNDNNYEGDSIWNDIDLKFDPEPYTELGYPDPTYLSRLKKELAAKGVTEDDIPR